MNQDRGQGDLPREVNPKKPLDDPHKIYFATLPEKAATLFLDLGILQEVNKVINVETKIERKIGNMTVRIIGISNKTGEEARILKRRGKTNGKENFVDFLVPMLRAAAKAIYSPEKKPIFIWFSLWITQGRWNNGNLFQGQNTLKNVCFATTLANGVMLLDRYQNQNSKRVATKNRSKAVAFAPDTVLVVAKDNNLRFGSKRIEILIAFYR